LSAKINWEISTAKIAAKQFRQALTPHLVAEGTSYCRDRVRTIMITP
jgi:hypothetical protein